ncbi:protein CURVATURE THYLAKOID 1D, chloroplastic isoform X1 [Hevea brasiliensis]|uniref:protein CURVATURE THYLAKOID 1D, chloroplastic isoform X1 n=1 Tax=Hevea brasiliensis TaxID=3981 RepID=UPI0025FBBAA4|nr:protein CURVATURE THYLAKOID 1D, chloroplastic isoform X1 [Hevea brasiliensis]
MELCTTQSLSNLPKVFTSKTILLRSKTAFTLQQAQIPRSGLLCSLHSRFLSVPRATAPEESSTGASLYATEERDCAVVVEVDPPIEKRVYNESRATGAPLDDSPVDEQVNGFLDNLNIKKSGLELWADNWEYFDSEDTYSILLYGGGALLALWLASAIVGAIDSIPLFPKLMEVVGLGYTIWFTTRYLLFKKSRDELAAKVEELKQQVLGTSDN